MPHSKSTVILCLAVAIAFLVPQASNGQQRVRLDDPTSAAVRALELGDPFFRLVIQRNPQPLAVAEVEAAIQPDASFRRAFAVHETIQSSAPGARRSVVSFLGSNTSGGTSIDVDGTVMLSVFFGPGRFPVSDDGTEAWGWDADRGRYNYYKRDGQSWFFRGTSSGPEVANRSGCMGCHHNGTPIMKELLVPWVNWNSARNQLAYLTGPAWNPPQNPIFPSGRLKGAEVLEGQILDALRRFHDHEIAAAREQTGAGTERIAGARELLRPLFETTEVNLASSSVTTGNLHPFSGSSSGPNQAVRIPNTHFLNARVIAATDLPGSGAAATLDISEAKQFVTEARIAPADYADAVNDLGLRFFMRGECSGAATGPAGDAHFAWLHLEPGLFDVTRIEKLLTGNLVSKDFVAAVLAIDLRTPIYSAKRAELLDFVPDSYSVTSAGPIDLTEQVLQAIDAAGPAASEAARDLASRLRDGDAMARLRQEVIDYKAEVADAFDDPTSAEYRQALAEQFEILLDRRELMRSRPELCAMVEGPLLPVRPN